MARSDGDQSCSPAGGSELRELSLEEVLRSYEQPINEEQAWAVCFQCCSGLQDLRPRHPCVQPSSLLLQRDGSVRVQSQDRDHQGPSSSQTAERQLVHTLGVAIYRALDWGLDSSEERELSPQLERLIEGMVGSEEGTGAGSGASDEGYSEPEEACRPDEDYSEPEEACRPVCSLRQVRALCEGRLLEPSGAPEHYQAVVRALFVETLELQTFLLKIRNAKQMLKKMNLEDHVEDRSSAELDSLQHQDWARIWVQLMKELRQGVQLKQVQGAAFLPLRSEFSLTAFETLMQDIRTRRVQLRRVMVDGDIPTRVKRDAHELILDFIRSRPPLKPTAARSLAPRPSQPQSLHEQVLAQIKQERKLRPIPPARPFGSLPCLTESCCCEPKSSSCMDLSVGRPRVLLKAPTLDEMEEMTSSEDDESSESAECGPMKRDRSFSEQDVALLRVSAPARLRTLPTARAPPQHRASFPGQSWAPAPGPAPGPQTLRPQESSLTAAEGHAWMEFSHPVESLALTVDEVINVRRVLVKAEMEKYLQNKDLYNSLKKGKVCCCCRVRFPLLSWPCCCLFCKRSVCGACITKMKIPSKKMAHIPVYAVGFEAAPKDQGHKSQVFDVCLEQEFPQLYAHGCSLREVCCDCSKFVADVVWSSRLSLQVLNTPKTKPRTEAQSEHAQDQTQD